MLLVINISVLVLVATSQPICCYAFNFSASKSPLGVFRFAAVAADAKPCSEIGTTMLARGGSAVDAAIAACLCTGVYNMHNAGLGGGSFMTIWNQRLQTGVVVDAREVAPSYATEGMFSGTGVSSTLGPLSIGVPGELAGYWAAHQRFGRLPWRLLFQPSIKLCTSGFEVSDALDLAIRQFVAKINALKDPSPFDVAMTFLTNPSTGKPFQRGDTMTCPLLAKTFGRIANLGAPAFYNGSIAEDLIADLQEAGSPMNLSDLAAYSVECRKPTETILQDRYRLISVPPPGSGAVLGLILNILSGYNLTSADKDDPLIYHRFIEAWKFAYGQRTVLGDRSFVPGIDDLVANMTNKTYGDYIRSLIDDSSTHPTAFYLPKKSSEIENHGTSHISVLDGSGNAVSITSTINVYFGSGIIGRRTGIIFNDEMDDFSSPNTLNYFNLPPSSQNFIRPGKRPQSSMCPAIVLTVPDDVADNDRPCPGISGNNENKSRVKMVIGAAGGSRITSATAFVTARVLWLGENVKEAIDSLRFHHQLIPETLYYEPGMPQELLDAMRLRGHVNQTEYSIEKGIMSVVQAIQEEDNRSKIYANSDGRKSMAAADGF